VLEVTWLVKSRRTFFRSPIAWCMITHPKPAERDCLRKVSKLS